jgi:hypothetical protein
MAAENPAVRARDPSMTSQSAAGLRAMAGETPAILLRGSQSDSDEQISRPLGHYVMQRKQLMGIARRAEETRPPSAEISHAA